MQTSKRTKQGVRDLNDKSKNSRKLDKICFPHDFTTHDPLCTCTEYGFAAFNFRCLGNVCSKCGVNEREYENATKY